MRARMSWLYSQIHAPAGVEHDLTPSSAGVSWVASLHAQTPVPGYRITLSVMTQVEEYLPVRDWPRHYTAEGFQPLGPSAKVCLYQAGVTTSAGFDWDYLLRLWPVMDQARRDWVRQSPRPKAPHDREGYQKIVAAGAPPFLGIGFGEAQTKINQFCMFGARIQWPAGSTLAGIRTEVAALAELTLNLAQVPPR
jgi:hypothetical protein